MEPISSQDRENLKLLSIFHYLFGGMILAFSLLQASILLSLFAWHSIPDYRLPSDLPLGDSSFLLSQFGVIVIVVGLAFLIFGLMFPFCLIASGRLLSKRKGYWFSFMTACIECVYTPFGTILGIFTLIVLSRQSVKALYGLNND